MATDYDAPRRSAEAELETDSLEALKAADSNSNGMDEDGEIIEAFEPPSVDISGEELNVEVVPRREGEFTCGECFIVQDRKHLAYTENGVEICRDCA